jgi:hypothetical protein
VDLASDDPLTTFGIGTTERGRTVRFFRRATTGARSAPAARRGPTTGRVRRAVSAAAAGFGRAADFRRAGVPVAATGEIAKLRRRGGGGQSVASAGA